MKAFVPLVIVSLLLFGCCITGPPTITTPAPEPGATSTPAPGASPTGTPALQPSPAEGCGSTITSCGCYIYSPGTYALGRDLNCDTGISFYGSASGSTFDCSGHSITSLGNESGDGIYIIDTNGLEVRNCRVSNFYEGIIAQNARNVVIYNTAVSGSPNGGIVLMHSNGCTVRNSATENSTNGIHVTDSNNTSILNNTFIGDRFSGLYLGHLNGATVSGNIAERCDTGLYMNNVTGARVQGNMFTNSTQSGIWVTNSRGNTIALNRVSGEGLGIGMESSTGNTFSENVLLGDPAFHCVDNLTNIDGGSNVCNGYPNDGCSWLSCP